MALELGIISSAWGGTPIGLEEGMRKAKEIGFDPYDVFEDPLDIDDATREQIWDISVGNLKQRGADARQRGVEIAIELEPFREALVRTSTSSRASSAPSTSRRKADADISHLHLSHASFEDVAALRGLIGHIHLSDCDGEVHGDLPPGRGATPIHEYLAALVDAGYHDGTVSIELEYSPDPDRIVDWAEEAYRETARIIDELGVRQAGGSRALG